MKKRRNFINSHKELMAYKRAVEELLTELAEEALKMKSPEEFETAERKVVVIEGIEALVNSIGDKEKWSN